MPLCISFQISAVSDQMEMCINARAVNSLPFRRLHPRRPATRAQSEFMIVLDHFRPPQRSRNSSSHCSCTIPLAAPPRSKYWPRRGWGGLRRKPPQKPNSDRYVHEQDVLREEVPIIRPRRGGGARVVVLAPRRQPPPAPLLVESPQEPENAEGEQTGSRGRRGQGPLCQAVQAPHGCICEDEINDADANASPHRPGLVGHDEARKFTVPPVGFANGRYILFKPAVNLVNQKDDYRTNQGCCKNDRSGHTLNF